MSYNFYGAKVVLFYILCKLNFFGDCFLPVSLPEKQTNNYTLYNSFLQERIVIQFAGFSCSNFSKKLFFKKNTYLYAGF